MKNKTQNITPLIIILVAVFAGYMILRIPCSNNVSFVPAKTEGNLLKNDTTESYYHIDTDTNGKVFKSRNEAVGSCINSKFIRNK